MTDVSPGDVVVVVHVDPPHFSATKEDHIFNGAIGVVRHVDPDTLTQWPYYLRHMRKAHMRLRSGWAVHQVRPPTPEELAVYQLSQGEP